MYLFLTVMSCIVLLVEGQAENCFDYDLPLENGETSRQRKAKCGVVDEKTANDPEKYTCVVEAFKAVKDGTVDPAVVKAVMEKLGLPEHVDALVQLGDSCSGRTVQKFVECFPPGVKKEHPKTRFFYLNK